MASIVERLQQEALDASVPVSSQLRRVKLIAAKLNLENVEDWVEKELSGYGSSEVPKYRVLRGQPKAFNPFNGWIPILIDDSEEMETISVRDISQKIPELEDVLNAKSDGTLQIPFHPDVIIYLNQRMPVKLGKMSLFIGRAAVVGIIDSVRNKILDWAIELEKTGIKGSDVSFSAEEKSLAEQPNVTMHIGSIGNFVGNLGVGNKAGDINAAIEAAAVESLIEQIRQNFTQLVSLGIDNKRLEDSLQKIEIALGEHRPDQGRLRSLLVDLRAIVTGAAGNLVASGAIQMINQILGTGVPSP